VEETIAKTDVALNNQAQSTTRLVDALRRKIVLIAQAAQTNPELPYQLANEVLRLVGHCAMAWMWLRTALVAEEKRDADPGFYAAKLDTVDYYFTFVLPETQLHLQVIDNCLENAARGKPFAFLPSLIS